MFGRDAVLGNRWWRCGDVGGRDGTAGMGLNGMDGGVGGDGIGEPQRVSGWQQQFVWRWMWLHGDAPFGLLETL